MADAIREKYYMKTPSVSRALFFPSKESERILASHLAKAEKTLDIAVFAFTNNVLAETVLARHKAGVAVRIITDDECSKFNGADVWDLALEGIPCTMDDNARLHMHNKFAVIDSHVLVTGSFNWTSQAVTGNQENLIIIENEDLCKQFTEEFEKLFEQFKKNKITKAGAKRHLAEQKIE